MRSCSMRVAGGGGIVSSAVDQSGSEKPEQLASSACGQRWRVEPLVVEEVFVAGHDRAGASGGRERDEVVVGGIAQDRWRRSRVAQFHARALSARISRSASSAGSRSAEVGLGEAASDFVEEERAGDGFEGRVHERFEEANGWAVVRADERRQPGKCSCR